MFVNNSANEKSIVEKYKNHANYAIHPAISFSKVETINIVKRGYGSVPPFYLKWVDGIQVVLL